MTRLLFLTILLILVICASGLCAPPYTDLPDNPRIEKLINQLGSKKYKDREEAQNQLRALPEAIPYLKAALASADPEVVERLKSILASTRKQAYSPKMLERRRNSPKSARLNWQSNNFLRSNPPFTMKVSGKPSSMSVP